MPIGPFKDFDACVLHMKGKGHDDKSARAICGKMEQDAKMAEEFFADFNSQWVEIFKAGDYADKGVWTEDDLDKIVANFSAGVWKPPAVIGHPETNSPAMGWVESLRRQGKTLLAKFSQVQPELESQVDNGRFPNRSAAFYTDPQGRGPVLRHVGFLGATPPEVKGLAPVKFSSTDFTEITFEEETMEKPIKEQIAEFFAELFGKKADAPTFSETQVNDLITKAVTAATTPLIEANKALGTKFDELGKKLEASNTATLKSKATAFVEKLKSSGKWIPAFDVAGIPALLEHAAVNGGTVKFGEAGKEKEFQSFDAMCAFLEQLPALVPTGNITGKVKDGKGNVVHFNEARGIEVDMASVALNERAQKIAKEQKVDFGEALRIAAEELSA